MVLWPLLFARPEAENAYRAGMGRALLVTPTAAPGGAERALAALARHLPHHGWHPVLASLGEGPALEWFRATGAAVEVLPEVRVRHLHRSVATVRELRSLIRRYEVDVVVGNQGRGHLFAGVAASSAGIPAVYWNHVIPGPDRVSRAASLVPAAAIVCSTDVAVEAQRKLSPRRRIVKIPPGVDIGTVAARRGSADEVRHLIGVHEGPLVGIVGRLQAWKGQDVFLRAAALLAERRDDVRFVVVGGAVLGWEGDEQARLERLAGELGVAGRVLFTGHVEDPYPWLDALDVVVNASTTPEPFGLVVLEAMTLGTPVVATMGGGPSEIITDGVDGLLVPPADPQALADAVGSLLAAPGRARDMAGVAAQRAARFDEAVTASGFADLLDDVVSGEHGPAPDH